MDVFFVLGISIILLGLTAFLVFRLIPITGRTRAWLLLGGAMALTAVHRLISFSDLEVSLKPLFKPNGFQNSFPCLSPS
jgi:hypothetical protein